MSNSESSADTLDDTNGGTNSYTDRRGRLQRGEIAAILERETERLTPEMGLPETRIESIRQLTESVVEELAPSNRQLSRESVEGLRTETVEAIAELPDVDAHGDLNALTDALTEILFALGEARSHLGESYWANPHADERDVGSVNMTESELDAYIDEHGHFPPKHLAFMIEANGEKLGEAGLPGGVSDVLVQWSQEVADSIRSSGPVSSTPFAGLRTAMIEALQQLHRNPDDIETRDVTFPISQLVKYYPHVMWYDFLQRYETELRVHPARARQLESNLQSGSD